jgi:hypothetical protein
MFEKISRVAEQAATNASRRQFLGRFGRAALGAAAAVGGILAIPDVAQAAKGVCNQLSDRGCRGRTFGSICRKGAWRGRCVSYSGRCVCQ